MTSSYLISLFRIKHSSQLVCHIHTTTFYRCPCLPSTVSHPSTPSQLSQSLLLAFCVEEQQFPQMSICWRGCCGARYKRCRKVKLPCFPSFRPAATRFVRAPGGDLHARYGFRELWQLRFPSVYLHTVCMLCHSLWL